MKIRLIRHATLWVEYAGRQLLIDPMFSRVGVNPPIANSTNDRRNPLVPLPVAIESMLQPDAVIVTHLHRDHWDEAASDALPHAVPVFCQPGDEKTLRAAGFTSATAVEDSAAFGNIHIIRTTGQHGTGDIGVKMGSVSGFVLKAGGEPTLYIAGDTIWCDDVKAALRTYQPDLVVVNAGGAQFASGDPITMNAEDVVQVCRFAPKTKVAAVHMNAINHCLVTRDHLRSRLAAEKLLERVSIPQDGEWI